eukprot:CFRG4937T1
MKLASDSTFEVETSISDSSIPRIVFLLSSVTCIVLSQTLMWYFFSKSLVICDSALEATVTNSAASFCLSGVLGIFIFGENISTTWWFGLAQILVGVYMINSHSRGAQSRSSKTE